MLVKNKLSGYYQIINDVDFKEYSDVREQIEVKEKTDNDGYIIRPAWTKSGKIFRSEGVHISYETIEGYYQRGFALLPYKECRNIIKLIIIKTGFENLNIEQKIIASKLFIATKEQRDTVHSISEQIKNGNIFHQNSKSARKVISDKIYVEIFNRINRSDARLILQEINQLIFDYVELGIETITDDGRLGIVDYLLSDFSKKAITIEGYANCKDFGIELVNIINQ